MTNRIAATFGAIATGAVLVASVVFAQETSPFGGFKHDRSQPIEITSDALEVLQAEELAIFSGEVVAGQGTLRLTSDILEVNYEEESESESETGAIKHMVAKGNVFISNGTETAQGNRAEYDVEAGKINMTGEVVLTQGGNVIAGDTLTIDTVSGRGRVEGGGKRRVSSIFTPKSAQKSEEEAPAKPACTPEQEAAAKAAGLKCVPAD
ncbi:MAG: lipopolysaccharide transport periplasmic protein LptA [Pseudomonadota bacterium]